jgi:hypothetical protein
MTLHLDDVQHRVTHQAGKVGAVVGSALDGFRDRTADVVRADGGSVFRELHGLGQRIDDVEVAVGDRLDASTAGLEAKFDAVLAASKRTTWPRRLVWITVGMAVGAAVAYLADPDRGKQRRTQLGDQAVARGRDLVDEAGQQVKGAVDRAKGEMIETVKDALPEHAEPDAVVLRQRIASEVLGKRDDVSKVVLRVDGPGAVALKGTVPTNLTERELLAQVAEVDGVIDVRSELSVSTT